MSAKQPENQGNDAWHPGIKSSLPSEYLPLSSMFQPENVFSSIETATELSDFTGLAIQQLVFFRPERLVIHELLVRVSADIFVSDGTRYEDLGINFRNVVGRILSAYIEPEMTEICDLHVALAQQARSIIDQELGTSIFMQSAPAEKQGTGFSLSRLLGSGTKKKVTG